MVKSLEKISFLCIGLTLILSLISFTAPVNYVKGTANAPALVIDQVNHNTRFSIQFEKARIPEFISFSNFFIHDKLTFNQFDDKKDNTAFTSYSIKPLCLKLLKLQKKQFRFFNNQVYPKSFIG